MGKFITGAVPSNGKMIVTTTGSYSTTRGAPDRAWVGIYNSKGKRLSSRWVSPTGSTRLNMRTGAVTVQFHRNISDEGPLEVYTIGSAESVEVKTEIEAKQEKVRPAKNVEAKAVVGKVAGRGGRGK